jgi:hypothetical protein
MMSNITVHEYDRRKFLKENSLFENYGNAIVTTNLPLPANGFNLIHWAKTKDIEYVDNPYSEVAVVKKKDIFDYLVYQYGDPPMFFDSPMLSKEEAGDLRRTSETQLLRYKEAVSKLSNRKKYCLVWESQAI